MSNSKTSSGFKNSKVDPVTSQRAQLYALVDAALEAGADASELASTLASLASSSEPSLSSSSSKVAPAPLAETQQQEQQQTIRGAAVPGGDRINSSKVHFVSIHFVHVFVLRNSPRTAHVHAQGGGDEHELREAVSGTYHCQVDEIGRSHRSLFLLYSNGLLSPLPSHLKRPEPYEKANLASTEAPSTRARRSDFTARHGRSWLIPCPLCPLQSGALPLRWERNAINRSSSASLRES